MIYVHILVLSNRNLKYLICTAEMTSNFKKLNNSLDLLWFSEQGFKKSSCLPLFESYSYGLFSCVWRSCKLGLDWSAWPALGGSPEQWRSQSFRSLHCKGNQHSSQITYKRGANIADILHTKGGPTQLTNYVQKEDQHSSHIMYKSETTIADILRAKGGSNTEKNLCCYKRIINYLLLRSERKYL